MKKTNIIEKLYMKCENDYIILRICNLYGRDKNKELLVKLSNQS